MSKYVSADSGSGSEEAAEETGGCLRRGLVIAVGAAVAALLLACAARATLPRTAAEPEEPPGAGVQCEGLGRSAPPTEELQLHFLFLTIDCVHHGDVWRSFFAQAPEGSWRAWVHCRVRDGCQQQLDKDGLSAFTLVPTVYSRDCRDNLSPMLQLLRFALAAPNTSGAALDKFIFLSGDALPLKPFRLMRSTLGEHPDASDMCILPRSQPLLSKKEKDKSAWPYFVEHRLDGTKEKFYLVKTSPWSILARMDAEALVASTPAPLALTPGLFQLPGGVSVESLRYYHCPDEDLVFTYIFGYYGKNHRSFPGVGPVQARTVYEQGCCRTWTILAMDALTPRSELELYIELASDPDDSIGHNYIVTIKTLSLEALALLRDSRYLFARKFRNQSTFPGYADIVFA